MSDEILVSKDNGICEIRLNRPLKKNALTLAMYSELTRALDDANADSAVRVLLICANGPVFCAGNDIGDFLAAGDKDFLLSPAIKFIEALIGFEKPIVAAVSGVAIGIGTTMLLHCDFTYASEAARFATPFVDLGLVPEAASSMLLPRRIGYAAAREMLLLGKSLDAKRAFSLGLVNELVENDVLAHAQERAKKLAAKAPRALMATRALLRSGEKEALIARAHEEGARFAEAVTSLEAREALTAFFEKRAPDFSKI